MLERKLIRNFVSVYIILISLPALLFTFAFFYVFPILPFITIPIILITYAMVIRDFYRPINPNIPDNNFIKFLNAFSFSLLSIFVSIIGQIFMFMIIPGGDENFFSLIPQIPISIISFSIIRYYYNNELLSSIYIAPILFYIFLYILNYFQILNPIFYP
jgi:hypothetical protein